MNYLNKPSHRSLHSLQLESSSHRDSTTALTSLKSSAQLKGLLTQKSARVQAHSSHDTGSLLLQRRSSLMQMMQTYSKHYDLIQQSQPLEGFRFAPPSELPITSKRNSFEVQHDGTLSLVELRAEQNNVVQINRFRFHYFFIRIFEQESPLQVYVKSPGAKLLTLRIYISTTAQFPTKFNCEHVVQSKYFKYTEKNHQECFSERNLYFSIYTEEDCEMQIVFLFGNKLFRRQKICKEKPNYEKYRNFLSSSKLEVSQMDKIQSNLDLRQHSKENKKSKLLQTQELLENRLKNAISKKRELLGDKKLELLSKFQAQDTLKEIRKQQQLLLLRKEGMVRLQKYWINMIVLFDVAVQIKSLLEQNRQKSKQLAKGRLLVLKYRTTTWMKVRETGQSVEERNRYKLCLSMAMFANQIKQKTRKGAAQIIYKFLKATFPYMRLVLKHKFMAEKVNYVKRVFKNMKLKHRAYRDRLFRSLTRYGQEILSQMGIQYSNQKKKTYSLDIHVLTKVMDEFIHAKKKKLQAYVQSYVREKDQRQKVVDFALNLMQPELFDTPSYDQLYYIYEQYVQIKKLHKA